MATYAELLVAAEDPSLNNKVRVAVVVSADIIRLENVNTASHTERVAWAKKTMTDPATEARRMIWAVLAQNRSATLAQILAASDSQVQDASNAAVNLLI